MPPPCQTCTAKRAGHCRTMKTLQKGQSSLAEFHRVTTALPRIVKTSLKHTAQAWQAFPLLRNLSSMPPIPLPQIILAMGGQGKSKFQACSSTLFWGGGGVQRMLLSFAGGCSLLGPKTTHATLPCFADHSQKFEVPKSSVIRSEELQELQSFMLIL